MKKIYSLIVSMMLLGLILSGCSSNEQAKKSTAQKQEVSQKNVELTISAAASLQDALNDIKANFEKANPNVKINFNFGASGALQQQISQGAPVDLFFSAAEDKFNNLVKDGLIEENQGKDVVGNELVLVVPKDTKKEINSFEELTKADKISIGTPDAVPAGQYGKETLENLNVWKAIEGKVVYGKDVRQVLSYVETNNVDAGIVYKTDALTSTKVKIVATAADNTHDPIIYPLGVIKDSKQPKEAKKFFEYLQNDESMKILEKYGFKGLN
ncbi:MULTISPECIES: molybdate ABC transporter substrate-binding protein [Bacillaceae]|uniref:Molybdate ABC transporter substrate-binding protein n=1 Tax=Gottfriedia luciferensis TaxID=178774 RepID=A0ABX2ZT68_9BACI|nr:MULTISPECIES: molybdate ABC transporter substrate-binding protein [Bacillaceae]ODG92963.1 molybdate ABC transporter substrate-binding protein [Gottfriedia luciferensis]PGZ93991.1 molybdate ABC transporter substrate-binding protein [Bacillus sp. AFS029533]